ncbi:Lysophospholipase L1 [Muriicola jejuensis]|uniref:G-D-S-L family lipolytic protein n=1 Tax=Muriicola jejuensis TaxID=504488 RepID=A0A6P0UFU3_9FLAO|nr:GDSL-type esterase/lipase family protein [Muriicola jejuensis]NER10759.1 G-D-S-L family lipolytic protein [Muriicola jejuensis]SMP16383.1 Lysophospholipase L1 [Muriicola jejuensis]
MKDLRKFAFIFIHCACLVAVWGQEKEDYSDEVARISEKYRDIQEGSQRVVVFTGSSSIRLWKGLEDSFPSYHIVNTGFGGSESADLLRYVEPLVLAFRPEKVFIYEGDNDLSRRKSPGKVLKTTREILQRIWGQFPDTEVVLIAAKPSPDRWNLRRKFRRFNRKLERYAGKSDRVQFANVWDVMLRGDQVDQSLFIEDGLHMNEKGYALWYEVLSNYLKGHL